MFAQFSDVYCILRLQRVLLDGFFYTARTGCMAIVVLGLSTLAFGGGLVAARWGFQTLFILELVTSGMG